MNRDRIAVGTRKGLLLFEKKGGAWSIAREDFMGVHVSYAELDPRGNVLFACLDHGHWGCKLHRSNDGGENWDELAAPVYPEGSVLGKDPFATGASEPRPAVLKYQWSLTAGAEDQPGRIYIGTEPGGLFVSDDGGDSFQLVDSLWNHPSRTEMWFGGGRDQPGIHSILVDPRNREYLFVGISCAGVFASADGGASWEPRNRGLRADYLPNPDAEVGHDPHLLVQCQSEPDKLWQQNHCGIFRSVDVGRTWTEVTQENGPANFGFTVVVDPNNGETAWVVPAVSDQVRVAIDRRLCVCRTDDGGQTWQDFRAGLPQEDCYDFAFRHGLALAGDRLTLGTAGGSLYVSDDRGESWQTVANHLPPVYSVRYV